jgi:SnoaL-like domain
VSRAAATTARWRTAAEVGDIEGFMATLSRQVVFHSPLTTLTDFKGHEDVRALMETVFATIDGIRYTEDVGDQSVRALVYRAEIAGQEVQEATVLRLNEEAEVVEATFWFRPLPGLMALAATLVPELARRHSRPRAMLIGLLTKPLFWLTRIGDSIGVRLAR